MKPSLYCLIFGLFIDRLLCHHEDDTKALLLIVKVFSEFLSLVHKLVFFVIIGSLRSYDGNCKENVTLKLNFALS